MAALSHASRSALAVVALSRVGKGPSAGLRRPPRSGGLVRRRSRLEIRDMGGHGVPRGEVASLPRSLTPARMLDRNRGGSPSAPTSRIREGAALSPRSQRHACPCGPPHGRGGTHIPAADRQIGWPADRQTGRPGGRGHHRHRRRFALHFRARRAYLPGHLGPSGLTQSGWGAVNESGRTRPAATGGRSGRVQTPRRAPDLSTPSLVPTAPGQTAGRSSPHWGMTSRWAAGLACGRCRVPRMRLRGALPATPVAGRAFPCPARPTILRSRRTPGPHEQWSAGVGSP
jgi:hypothetical protein